ncbi:hypothetical protein D3C84_986760 [compost metagenome]
MTDGRLALNRYEFLIVVDVEACFGRIGYFEHDDRADLDRIAFQIVDFQRLAVEVANFERYFGLVGEGKHHPQAALAHGAFVRTEEGNNLRFIRLNDQQR